MGTERINSLRNKIALAKFLYNKVGKFNIDHFFEINTMLKHKIPYQLTHKEHLIVDKVLLYKVYNMPK